MKNLKQKLRIFILSHLFKNTFKDYCSQMDANRYKDEEIGKLREVNLNQVNIIANLKEANHLCEEEKNQFQIIVEEKEDKIRQLLEIHQLQDIQIKQYNDFEKSNETEELLKNYIVGKVNNDYSNMYSFTYDSLHKILDIDKQISIETFKIISNDIYKYNLEVIKNQPKIKVAFLCHQSSLWSCDSIYNKLSNDNRFETYIVIVPFEYGTDKKIINDEYIANCSFFEKKEYKYIKSYNVENLRYLSFEEIGSPNIIFHLTPHTTYIPQNFRIESLQLNVINVYIPYGYMIVNGYEVQFNQKSHHLFWKIFCETPLHKKMAREYSKINDINVECSGYVKMDQYFDNSDEKENIWKIAISNTSDLIKIIWAPHHALVEHPYAFGTFHKNYLFFYELAKSMPEVSWIVKPHPLLKNDSIHFGVFRDANEYDEYMKKWDELPNARTVQEGSYIDIFKTSDAMILDSVSFLAEYLFTQKPCLFLTKSCDTFNDFGQILKDTHYQTDGENLDGIKDFINEVIIKKNDNMKEIRSEIFNKYINYLNFNDGKLAYEYIYQYLSVSLDL